jgi:hypothetical protein
VGKADYYGMIDEITQDEVLGIIYRFIMDRIQSYRYHVDKDTNLNYCATYAMSSLDLKTQELRCSDLVIRDGGRTILLNEADVTDWNGGKVAGILDLAIIGTH